MRITGGVARSIQLKAPKGDATRPATDQMRERVFSYLGDDIQGSRVLDAFAGTGSYGLEALSRGAAGVTFVEKHGPTAAILKDNLAQVLRAMASQLPLASAPEVLVRDMLHVSLAEGAFDLIFLDPPYPLIESLAPRLMESCALWSNNGLLCFEMPARLTVQHERWTPLKRLGKGSGDAPTVTVFQKNGGLIAAI